MTEHNKDHFIERRRHPRYEVRYVAKVWSQERDLCGTVIDISEGGVGILLPQVLSIGQELDLEIESIASGEKIKSIKFKARIVWMNEEEFLPGMYRGGLEISSISQEDLDALKDHIQALDEQGQSS